MACSAMNVCAVIVTYNPAEARLVNVIAAVQAQVSHIVIVDNAAEGGFDLAKLAADECLTIIKNNSNVGLAKAQNMGIQWALDQGCKYVLILDQDSIPAEGMVDKLVKASESLKSQGVKLCAVGPRYGRESAPTSHFLRFGQYRYERLVCPPQGEPLLECSFLISSGTLVAAEVFSVVGFMDETLFIDHIDTEWCMRAVIKGYSFYGVCNAYMGHELGEKVVEVWWGRDRVIPIHHPFRLYYIFRNSVLLFKRKNLPLKWKLFDLKRLMVFPVLYILFSDEKLKSLKFMALGIFHGLLGRSGKLKN
jgi:rhamnosyltransferase